MVLTSHQRYEGNGQYELEQPSVWQEDRRIEAR